MGEWERSTLDVMNPFVSSSSDSVSMKAVRAGASVDEYRRMPPVHIMYCSC